MGDSGILKIIPHQKNNTMKKEHIKIIKAELAIEKTKGTKYGTRLGVIQLGHTTGIEPTEPKQFSRRSAKYEIADNGENLTGDDAEKYVEQFETPTAEEIYNENNPPKKRTKKYIKKSPKS